MKLKFNSKFFLTALVFAFLGYMTGFFIWYAYLPYIWYGVIVLSAVIASTRATV